MAYTHEQVKNIFANAGCELLSQYYTAKEAVQYRCSCGTISFISLSNFTRGKRCKKCGYTKATQQRAFNQEYIAQYFKKYGCELLDIYVNNHTKIKYRCLCGNVSFTQFHAFQQAHQCKQCGHAKIGGAHAGEKSNFWNSDREQVRRNQQIKKQQYHILCNCLKRLGTQKEGHVDNILGYSAIDLDRHLRSFPMYAYLQDAHTLAIDHILPVKAFVEHGINDPAIICALDNLQPLSRSENLEKSDWYLEEEFLLYCKSHNISLLKEVV